LKKKTTLNNEILLWKQKADQYSRLASNSETTKHGAHFSFLHQHSSQQDTLEAN